MKTKSLQFGKAMSAALFVLLLSVAGMKNAFAQYQAATLQHEGNISVFYGPDALSNAHAAAATNDTITLSGGNFNGCIISKALTIHGAGIVADTASSALPTQIISDIRIDKPDGTMPLTIEGVWFNTSVRYGYTYGPLCRNVRFIKCNINEVSLWTHYCFGFCFENCIIKWFDFYGEGLYIQNSVVRFNVYNQSNQNNTNIINNSVVCLNDYVSMSNTNGYNSIIATANGNAVPNSVFYNCVNVQTGNSNLFEGQMNQTNMQVNSYEDVFETFTGTVTYDNSYQLNNEMSTSFLGNDGTEVGIYGGMLPYNTRLSYMIMRRCNVAGRTTIDDKLSVEIELNIDE